MKNLNLESSTSQIEYTYRSLCMECECLVSNKTVVGSFATGEKPPTEMKDSWCDPCFKIVRQKEKESRNDN